MLVVVVVDSLKITLGFSWWIEHILLCRAFIHSLNPYFECGPRDMCMIWYILCTMDVCIVFMCICTLYVRQLEIYSWPQTFGRSSNLAARCANIKPKFRLAFACGKTCLLECIVMVVWNENVLPLRDVPTHYSTGRLKITPPCVRLYLPGKYRRSNSESCRQVVSLIFTEDTDQASI